MSYSPSISSASDYTDDRSLFIRRVYGHLALALLAFVALEAFLLSIPAVREFAIAFATKGRGMWFLAMLGLMGVAFMCSKMAMSNTSLGTQYAGLGLYVVAEALFFLPLIGIILLKGEGGSVLLMKAGLITGGLFLGLSTVALTTKRDLSGFGRFVKVGLGVAFGIIIASVIFGFNLGVIFMSAMVLLMAACILWKTQEIQREYPGSLYVAASLALFSSFLTMLWYVIQLLMSSSRD